MISKHHEERDSGQALVIFALSLIALIGFVALVIDGGRAYANRIKMQTAADAAAVAGAIKLADGAPTPVVVSTAEQYAKDNGAVDVQITIENDNIVHVRTSLNSPTFFAAALGVNKVHATAEGAAKVEAVGAVGNLLPMAVYDQEFEYGETYELFNEKMEAPGAFGWLDWDGPPSPPPELAYRILHPETSGVWHVGDWVRAAPGLRPTPCVINALREWIGKEALVPLYDSITGMGCFTRYHISGFAAFVITDVEVHCGCGGPRFRVYGYFVRKVIEGASGGGTEDRGLRTVTLVQ